MLLVDQIHAYYGQSYVLQGITFKVEEGQIVGLLGRNGVGKTTTIRSVVGFIKPRRGRITFKGCEIQNQPAYKISRLGIGLVPQGRRVFDSLSVYEHLALGVSKKEVAETWDIRMIYDLFPRLKEREGQMANTLSGGEQSMLSIGRALMMNPSLLVMDEPTEGLAPIVVQQVANTIASLKAGKQSILLVEQNIGFALEVADIVHVMSKGRIVFSGTPEELRGRPDVEARYLGVGNPNDQV